MNSYYLTSSSREELERKERLQQKHYHLLNELQHFASDLPIAYQQRLPYELLSNLASAMLDETVSQIVAGLKEIQAMTEKTLFESRMREIGKFRELKVNMQKKHKQAQSDKSMTPQEMRHSEKELERYIEEETNKIDMKIVNELDQVVSEQQVTLEKAGVPGFYLTNNPNEIKLQMYILEFITRLGNRGSEVDS